MRSACTTKPDKTRLRWCRALSICAVSSLVFLFAVALPLEGLGEEPEASPSSESESSDAPRAGRLATMREIVSSLRFESGERERQVLELLPEPLLRYSDAPHGLEDATVWVWQRGGQGGRPAVLLKLESYPKFQRVPIWSFCLTSLADEAVAAPFGRGKSWSAKSPHIAPQWLSGAASPAENAEQRLRQMRDIARRFTGYRVYGEFGRTELRLLARPAYRYKSESDGIVDGAVFCFAKDLNPHIALLIEAAAADGETRWRYAQARHSDAECHLLLDGQEVWKVDMRAAMDPRQPYYWFQWPADDVKNASEAPGEERGEDRQ
ncbi:MAG TPA: hypothetical protein VG826_19450 [Pirellulales bacterium]|nr:hypothetical protein [Pirellulales bacterium]